MTYAQELLDAAGLLLACEQPTEATRRRAVSTAYYAVFHLLVDAAVTQVAVGHASPTANLARRAPTHTHLKKLCGGLLPQENQKTPVRPPAEWRAAGFDAPVSAELGRMAADVVALHAARETADYDLGAPLGPLDAELHGGHRAQGF